MLIAICSTIPITIGAIQLRANLASRRFLPAEGRVVDFRLSAVRDVGSKNLGRCHPIIMVEYECQGRKYRKEPLMYSGISFGNEKSCEAYVRKKYLDKMIEIYCHPHDPAKFTLYKGMSVADVVCIIALFLIGIGMIWFDLVFLRLVWDGIGLW